MNELKTMLTTPDHISGIIDTSAVAIVRIDNKIYASVYSELWGSFGEFVEIDDLARLDIFSDDLSGFRYMTDEELYYVVGMIDIEE